MRVITPKQSWEVITVISIDLIGPYSPSCYGKTNILVVIDCFSRWTEAYPLGTATTKTITETLEREFFSRFDYPRVCLSDNSPQFVSKEMEVTLNRWEVTGWTTPVYHPRETRLNAEIKS